MKNFYGSLTEALEAGAQYASTDKQRDGVPVHTVVFDRMSRTQPGRRERVLAHAAWTASDLRIVRQMASYAAVERIQKMLEVA